MIENKLNISEEFINSLEEKEKHIYEESLAQKESPKQEVSMFKKTFIEDIPEHHKSFIKLNKEIVPSECKYYPSDWTFYIRPARVLEIRDFSSLESDTSYKTNEAINAILSTCVKITSSTSQIQPKHILEIDKIFFLLAIRDLTFYEIENPLHNVSKCPICSKQSDIEIFSNNTLFFEHTPHVLEFFDRENYSFVFRIEKTGETLSIKPPSISITEKVNNFYRQATEKGLTIDQATLSQIRYLNINWNSITYEELYKHIVDFQNWSMYKYSIFTRFVNDFENLISTKSVGICSSCSAEVTVPFSFQGSYRSIFLVQDPYRYAR